MIKNWIRLPKLSLIVLNQYYLGPQRVRNLDPLDQFTVLDKLAFSETLKCTKMASKLPNFIWTRSTLGPIFSVPKVKIQGEIQPLRLGNFGFTVESPCF